MTKFSIRGTAKTRTVYLNGTQLDPAKSLAFHNHSPDGFNWGYCGSGPAQLALSVLMEVLPLEFAALLYVRFKDEIIANIPQDQNFEIDIDFMDWLEKGGLHVLSQQI